MALFKLRTTTDAIITVNSKNIIAVIDETKVKDYNPSLGQCNLFIFGGLSFRTHLPAIEIEKFLEKTETLIDLVPEESKESNAEEANQQT